jgi:hypothetical protein
MKNRNKINKALLADTYEVKMNLTEDWDNHLNDRMINMGYRPKQGGYNSLDYHKAMKKLIPVRPRKVYFSEEFSCPDECKNALNNIVSAIESGKNLLPYMSKLTIRPSKNDGLLNDWNIHHFHLNDSFEKNSIFVKRSDWLLLAFVRDDAVYCINVYPHKKPYLWSHIKMVRIVHKNWPELIEKNRIKEVSVLTEEIDDKKYDQIRRANTVTMLDLGENQVYAMIGGGYSSDGSSTEAVTTSDYWYNYIRKIELYIRDDYQNFKKQMLPFDSFSVEKKLEIDLLTLTDEELILLEKQRKVIIKINYNNGNIRMCKLSSLLDEFLYDSLESRFESKPLKL